MFFLFSNKWFNVYFKYARKVQLAAYESE